MNPSNATGKITPLWIVAAFVMLTETVLGYALTKTEGGVQVALTVFVIFFAMLVFSGFFVVLWVKPYVFYPPSEYSDGDPSKFVEAMRPRQSRVFDQIELAQKVGSEPDNREALFGVMDSLIDDAHRQFLILMHQDGIALPYFNYFGAKYEVSRRNGSWASGGFNAQDFAKKLDGTDLLQINVSGPSISLTPTGHEFATWLIDGGRRADYLATPFGGWGERIVPDGLPPSVLGPPPAIRPLMVGGAAPAPNAVATELSQCSASDAVAKTVG